MRVRVWKLWEESPLRFCRCGFGGRLGAGYCEFLGTGGQMMLSYGGGNDKEDGSAELFMGEEQGCC